MLMLICFIAILFTVFAKEKKTRRTAWIVLAVFGLVSMFGAGSPERAGAAVGVLFVVWVWVFVIRFAYICLRSGIVKTWKDCPRYVCWGTLATLFVISTLVYELLSKTPAPPQPATPNSSPSPASPSPSVQIDWSRAKPITHEEYLRDSLGMEEFNSDDYAFQVFLPHRPSPRSEGDVVMFQSLGQGKMRGYLFQVFTNVTRPYSDDRTFLEDFVKSVSADSSVSNLVASKKVTDGNGHEGTEFTYTGQNGDQELRGRGRVFRANGRAYVVEAIAPKELWNDAVAEIFLDTFRIK